MTSSPSGPSPVPPPGALVVEATCRGPAACTLVPGEDLWFDIKLTNPTEGNIEVPLAYLQKTGPVIRLVDRRGGETHVRRPLADPDLKGQLTAVPPGGSVMIAWVLHDADVAQLGEGVAEVTAHLTIATDLELDGRTQPFKGTTQLDIVVAAR
jgi:hypothetical protein